MVDMVAGVIVLALKSGVFLPFYSPHKFPSMEACIEEGTNVAPELIKKYNEVVPENPAVGFTVKCEPLGEDA